MTINGFFKVIGLASFVALLGCGEDEFILPGERLDPRTGEPIASQTGAENTVRALAAGPAVVNGDWTHVNGGPAHDLRHVALGPSPKRLWSVDIGDSESRGHRITAQPVVSGGLIYTLDAQAQVSAVSTAGRIVWTADLTPPGDSSGDASGGGLAVAGGRLFVTSGFGTLTALDAVSGAKVWEQDLDAAATGAPAVSGNTVYVVTRNGVGWAIDTANGRIRWQVLGTTSVSGLAGGPAPTIADRLVIFPFSSGQMLAVVAGTGATAWAGTVAGARPGRAFSRIQDLSGAPVFDGARVYAASHAGRMAAFDATTGQVVWTLDEGGIGPLWRAGDSVFAVTDENRLIRVLADTGETVWALDLPLWLREKQSRRKEGFVHFGPVLAGGRLILVSDDGQMRSIDPSSGAITATTDLPGKAATGPVVAGGVLYVVTEGGQLHAFR